MRRAAKVDANQDAVVSVLKAYGATVQSLAAIGKGCPDLLVGYRGHTLLVEVKDGRKPPSHRQLTEHQQKWMTEWKGGTVAVVKDIEGVEHLLRTINGSTAQSS